MKKRLPHILLGLFIGIFLTLGLYGAWAGFVSNFPVSSGQTLTDDLWNDLMADLDKKISPQFIDPEIVYDSDPANSAGWTNFNASGQIPSGAAAAILEAECELNGPDSGDKSAHIRIRKNSSSPSYILLRGESSGDEDHISLANQGMYPISASRTFQYRIEEPGFKQGCTIRLIGYKY